MRTSWLPLLVAVLACVAHLPAHGAEPTVLPLEYFTKHDEFGTVKISPAGDFLAVTSGRYGRSLLSFVSLKDKKVVAGVRMRDGFEVFDFRWVSPTRLIYMLGERNYRMKQPVPTGEIYSMDSNGKNHLIIYGYRAGQDSTGTHIAVREYSYADAELISALKDDDENILIAEHPWRETTAGWRHNPEASPKVVLLNTFSGKKRSKGVVPLADAAVLVDNADQVRFAIGRNDKVELAVAWKSTPDAPWTSFELPGFREESVFPWRFASDDRSVFFTGVREGETFSALYRLDLQTHAIEKVHGFADSDVTGLVADFADREVVGVMGYSDRPLYHWLAQDDRAVKLHLALQRAFPGQDVSITSTTDDGSHAIVFVDSDTNPGDYYLFDTVKGKADYLRSARQWIDPQLMRPKKSIQVIARDGQVLHGYLTQPAGEGPHPLVVLPHGGPYGVRDTREFDSEVQLLANRGYSVLQVNFRGSDGYGIDFNNAGYRQWGGTMQDDLTDATRWVIEQKIAAADRICIFGSSYGGYAALMGAAKEPKLYRCAVGYAGVYDLQLMFTSADIPLWKRGRLYLEEALGTDAADLRARSPVHQAAKIEIPVLLIHGKADWRSDYEQGMRMKAALEAGNKKVEWMSQQDEGHGVYDEVNRRDMYERILKFLDANLKTP